MAGPGLEAVLETEDQLALELVLQAPVVGGQSCDDRVDGAVEVLPPKLEGRVDGGQQVGVDEQGAQLVGRRSKAIPSPLG